jgi:hypothetical protein
MRIALCLAAIVALAGCSNNKTDTTTSAAATPVNAKCPVSGKAVDNTKTVSYKGQTVGFCCGNCPSSWAKLSDAEKDAKLAAAKK